MLKHNTEIAKTFIFDNIKKLLQDNCKSAHSEFYRNDSLWWAWYTVKKLKIRFLNGQGWKVYMLFFNPCLLFYCCLVYLPRKPFKIPLIWYIYHLSRSHRSWDMTDWPIWVSAFWSKFTDPYFGPGLTEKSNIWGIFFFHGIQQPHQKLLKSVMVMSDFNSKRVDLAWNHP